MFLSDIMNTRGISFYCVAILLVAVPLVAGLTEERFQLAVEKAAGNDDGSVWAVLVAGSNTWANYRHQADVCHAYQILHKYGIPDDHIIVMMYDDIADNLHNPQKGKIFNEPNGPDVYANVPHDYTKNEVTPDNFLRVLSGKAPSGGSGKIVRSTANDNIFVFFADHGAPGLIAFPTTDVFFSHVLTADKLLATLKTMHDDHSYNQIVLYVEACESGSMFNQLLPTDWSIYAVTAATPYESSYACYYDDRVRNYLGDCFSNHWMEDADAEQWTSETWSSQYALVQADTNTSTVCEYGDLSVARGSVGQFIRAPQQSGQSMMKQAMKKSSPVSFALDPRFVHVASSRDVELFTLRNRLAALPAAEPSGASPVAQALTQQMSTLLRRRAFVDGLVERTLRYSVGLVEEGGSSSSSSSSSSSVSSLVESILHGTSIVTDDPKQCSTPDSWEDISCGHQIAQSWSVLCGPFDDYSLRHVATFVRWCQWGRAVGVPRTQMTDAVQRVCVWRD